MIKFFLTTIADTLIPEATNIPWAQVLNEYGT
jgi:hypothetical protein